jgi:hypothetical protein
VRHPPPHGVTAVVQGIAIPPKIVMGRSRMLQTPLIPTPSLSRDRIWRSRARVKGMPASPAQEWRGNFAPHRHAHQAPGPASLRSRYAARSPRRPFPSVDGPGRTSFVAPPRLSKRPCSGWSSARQAWTTQGSCTCSNCFHNASPSTMLTSRETLPAGSATRKRGKGRATCSAQSRPSMRQCIMSRL